MKDTPKRICSLFALLPFLIIFEVSADEHTAGISKQIVNMSALTNVSGHNFTAVEVELAPGFSTPSHTHGGFVFVYVLEGTVHSQLNNGDTLEFSAGQSWAEPPGTVHSLTHNPSTTEKAKLLAVFVAKDGSELTTFGNDH